jgi:hypothetical protein
MTTLVAIDPGKITGLASFYFNDEKWLLSGASAIVSGYANLKMNIGVFKDLTYIICEYPQIYSSRLCKGDPNDLLPLAAQCGHVEAIALDMGAQFFSVTPQGWKKQVPKQVHHARLKLAVIRELSKEALITANINTYCTSIEHNKWDAIGLGLWFLKQRNFLK